MAAIPPSRPPKDHNAPKRVCKGGGYLIFFGCLGIALQGVSQEIGSQIVSSGPLRGKWMEARRHAQKSREPVARWVAIADLHNTMLEPGAKQPVRNMYSQTFSSLVRTRTILRGGDKKGLVRNNRISERSSMASWSNFIGPFLLKPP